MDGWVDCVECAEGKAMGLGDVRCWIENCACWIDFWGSFWSGVDAWVLLWEKGRSFWLTDMFK